ncbi:IPT/TIG domain-containing protein [bacterium]|nr:IPT/TIG domain-containing protein [bacterium]
MKKTIFFTVILVIAGLVTGFGMAKQGRNTSHQALTFEQRLEYQQAIEQIYYEYRLWPEGSAQSRPSFEESLSEDDLRQKVEDTLKTSYCLQKYWDRPLKGEQLQAELDRYAANTLKPQMLQKLYNALGNDPYLIAECLVRPFLADRLCRQWYSFDERFHKPARVKALELVRKLDATTLLNVDDNNSFELHYRLDDNAEKQELRSDGPRQVTLDQFNKIVALYPDRPGDLLLDEAEDAFIIRGLVEKSATELKVCYRFVPKHDFKEWIADIPFAIEDGNAADTSRYAYTLPSIRATNGEFKVDRWITRGRGITGRSRHTAIWTGAEMIVWGGYDGSTPFLRSGGVYYPATDHWEGMYISGNAPSGTHSHTAVWTGSEMIVWGGLTETDVYSNTGARFNPTTRVWSPMMTYNAPIARYAHTAVWTGAEMIVWGGSNGSYLNSGGRYNPTLDLWQPLSTVAAPTPRSYHTGIWADRFYQMIVWGGLTSTTNTNSGGLYNPASDTWTTVSTATGVPDRRAFHTAVWTGNEMIIWGGDESLAFKNTGGLYDPETDSWTVTATLAAPAARRFHTAVWADDQMIVWGGSASALMNSGGCYDVYADSWMALPTTNAPTARYYHSSVWAGDEMIVWGGAGVAGQLNNGGRFLMGSNSSTQGWVTVRPNDVPCQVSGHTVLWSGSEMMVWGGERWYGDYMNTGALYYPVTDSWKTMPYSSAPSPRINHTAVWANTLMAIWGGYDSDYLNTGGRYVPSTDTWYSMVTTNAPEGRSNHTAHWSPQLRRMMVWGGHNGTTILNTGGRYALAGTWTEISTVNAPTARTYHTSVWTGDQMLVYGGSPDYVNNLNTGGCYTASSDTWTSMTTVKAPLDSSLQKAVWTGTEMLVWGGRGSYGYARFGQGAYNPGSDSWRTMSTDLSPPTYGYSAVWTGSDLIVWGGSYSNTNTINLGGQYHPGTDSWTFTDLSSAPGKRTLHQAVWTGSEMIIVGGKMQTDYQEHFAIYFPNTAPHSAPDIINTDDTLTIGLDETLYLSHMLPTTWWYDDVEGFEQWTTTGNWQVINGYLQDCTGLNDYYSATHSWYFGNPDQCDYDTLSGTWYLTTSNPISIKPDSSTEPLFMFRYFLDTDMFFKDDTATVEVRLNSGSWQRVATDQSHWSSVSDGIPLDDSCMSWQAVSICLSDFLGSIAEDSTLEVRFGITSGATDTAGIGWFIDDIGLGHPAGDGNNPTNTIPYHDTWDWATYDWDINTDGVADNPDNTVPNWSIQTADLANYNLSWPGDYPLSLTITDSLGAIDTEQVILHLLDGVPPTVSLITPNGGESWAYSETGLDRKSHLIVWDADDNFGLTRTRLEYSSDAGTTWSCIVDSDYYSYEQSGSIAIPDNDLDGAKMELTVTESYIVRDINVEIVIQHESSPDLELYLMSPDATMITLADNPIKSGSDFNGTIFDDEATVSISDGSPPFTGYYIPEEALTALDGKNAAGIWCLLVIDNHSTKTGTIKQFALSLSACGPDILDDINLSPDAQNYNWEMPTEDEAEAVGQTFPTAEAQVRVQVWDESDNSVNDTTDNNFYLIQPTTTAIRTLVLWHSDRMVAKYGMDESAFMFKLQELADHNKVIGEILDLANAGIDYAAWDADPTDVAAANAVATQIRSYILTQLETYTNTQYLILVGDDHLIPFYRMTDGTTIYPESSYIIEGNLLDTHAVGAALASNYFLTDNFYSELDEEDSGMPAPHDLVYLSDLALGRLVETPEQIQVLINTFLAVDGQVNLIESQDRVLITGFDFIYDSAFDIKNEFTGSPHYKPTDCLLDDPDQSGTTDPCLDKPYSPVDLSTQLLIALPHQVSNINTHANHYGFAASIPAGTTDDILCTVPSYNPSQCYSSGMDSNSNMLTGTILYTSGCHSGLNVPDTDTKPLDLPEQMAKKKVLAYIGNTGYGWGLRYGKGLTEKMMELISNEILQNGSISLGKVVADAKRMYYLEEKRYDVFDEKVLHELTFYGIPNTIVVTEISKMTGSKPALPLPNGPDQGCAEGICLDKQLNGSSKTRALPPGVTELELDFGFGSATYQEIITPDGSYYTLNSKASSEVGDSIQPQFVYDSSLSGTEAHGVLFTSGTYTSESGFDPVVAVPRSTNIDNGEGALPLVSGFTPCVRVSYGSSGGSAQKTIAEEGYTNLIVHTGYYDQTADQQYRFESMQFIIYYSNLSDITGPVITDPAPAVFHTVDGMTASFSVEVTDPDSDVFRVLMTYNNLVTDQWQTKDLDFNTGSGLWEGLINLKGDIIYFVQAVDNAGNISILSDSNPDLDGLDQPYGSTWQGPRIYSIELDLNDSDNDLIPDLYEDLYFCLNKTINDADDDYDLDGLTNFEEYTLETNPCDGDTDGSGDNDGSELHNNRDPLDPNDDKHVSLTATPQGDDILIEWLDGISSSPCAPGTNNGFNNVIDGPYWVYRSTDVFFDYDECLIDPENPLPDGTNCYLDTTATGPTYYYQVWNYRLDMPAPDIVFLNPASGPAAGGSSVEIYGNYFTTGAAVFFNGVAASFTSVVNSSKITCVTPANPTGYCDVTVINPNGQEGSLSHAFQYM